MQQEESGASGDESIQGYWKRGVHRKKKTRAPSGSLRFSLGNLDPFDSVKFGWVPRPISFFFGRYDERRESSERESPRLVSKFVRAAAEEISAAAAEDSLSLADDVVATLLPVSFLWLRPLTTDVNIHCPPHSIRSLGVFSPLGTFLCEDVIK